MMDIAVKSILTTEGEDWKKRRKYLSPFFKAERLTQYIPTIQECCQKKISEWKNSNGQLLDIEAEMSSLTMMVISRIFFGEHIDQHVKPLQSSLEDVLKHHWSRLKIPGDLAHKLPNPGKSRFFRGMNYINATTKEIIEKGNKTDQHLLAKFLAENPDSINIEDEVRTILLAGHDTTSCALSWTIGLVSQNKNWAEKIASESDSDDRPASQAAFKEAMRLYPPIWLLERKAIEKDVIGNHIIHKGDSMLIAPWIIHRRKDLWEQPEKFHPQRFLDFKKDPDEFIPFGMGKHTCIASQLALLEAEFILPSIFRQIEFIPPEKPLKPKAGLTLKIKGGLKLKFKIK
jgi:cytochrome P450